MKDNDFTDYSTERKCIKTFLKDECLEESLTNKLDNKYVKYIGKKHNRITLKANKKFKNLLEKNITLAEKYIYNMLSALYNHLNPLLEKDENYLSKAFYVFTDIDITKTNKIIIRFIMNE